MKEGEKRGENRGDEGKGKEGERREGKSMLGGEGKRGGGVERRGRHGMLLHLVLFLLGNEVG